jgi:hypothetical protein
MTRGRRGFALGLAAAGAYVALAAVSGHLDPLARGPLLDGLAPPPPYRWVQPPPDLAAGNKPPIGVRFRLAAPKGSSSPAQIATGDQQASILLFPGAIRTGPGVQYIEVSIEPLAPSNGAVLPADTEITGNLYRITAQPVPQGEAVVRLRKSAQVALVYPALAGIPQKHVLLASADGRRFSALSAADSFVKLQISSHVQSLGYFAVGARTGAGASPTPSGGGGGTSGGVGLIVGIAAAVLIVLVILWWRTWRREAQRKAEAAAAQARATPRRPPPRRRRRR